MMTVLAVLLAAPGAACAYLMFRGERRRAAVPVFRVPPAEETAESVRRFHAAAERDANLDLAWERFSHGRGLLLDDLRAAAASGRRRRKRSPIPRWV